LPHASGSMPKLTPYESRRTAIKRWWQNVSPLAVREILLNAEILENYPEHKRGPCCLCCGKTSRGSYVHVVCTTASELTIIITVYEPKPPNWTDPFVRGKSQ
jgi:hypothetical protein